MIYSRHEIYDEYPAIEDKEKQLIYIPLFNKYKKVVGQAISNLRFKDMLLEFKYHLLRSGKTNKEYVNSNINTTMHELVMGKKAPEGFIIDHINSTPQDNRRENLQFAPRSLNVQNSKKENGTSIYKGVSKNKNNKWRASMQQNKKTICLGTFDKEIDAARMYDIHTINYYKDYQPRTNGLLTEAEIENIRLNGIPKEFQIEKIQRELPQYISFNNKRYCVDIVKNKQRFRKYCKSLEEAKVIKENFLKEIKDLEETQEKERVKNITRNKDGLAIITTFSGTECIVDDEVWPDVSKYSWNNGKFTYPIGCADGNNMSLHRYIYLKYVNSVIPKGMTVDHINNIIYDARIQNLRLANASLQGHNQNVAKDRIDRYRGIRFTSSGFGVYINKKYYGSFTTAEDAAAKANEIFKIIYGDNAKLNIIDYSKRTTRENRILDTELNRDFILNLKRIMDLKNIVTNKKLNTIEGAISLQKINIKTFEEYKLKTADLLFPLI